MSRKTFDERFWYRVNKTDGCWLWTGSRNSDGYGRYSKSERAHQAAYRNLVGPIPEGMCVCHKCDVPECVNPDHLFIGTQGDNNRDRNAKGRTSRASVNQGSAHGMSVLDETTVERIRDMRAYGLKLREIGGVFGVSEATVSLVARGLRWTHVGG